MPHLSGVFDEFPDLDKIHVDQLMAWISQKPEVHFLVNSLGNRILYPQTIPLTKTELEIDFAILRVGIRLKPSLVFQPQTNKIVIPKLFVDRFPPLKSIVLSIIEGINPKGTHFIYIKEKPQLKLIGSVVSPPNPQKLSRNGTTVTFSSGKINKQMPLNSISLVELPLSETIITLGDEEFKVSGGEVGVMVDLRIGGVG